MSRQIKVTEDKYNAVKILLKSGETQKKVGKYMGLAENTVGLIKRSENFEDYRNRMLATSVKFRGKDNQQEQKTVPEPEKKEQPAQVVEYRQNVTIQATHYMMEEMRIANETLKLISNKLAFIVEELTK